MEHIIFAACMVLVCRHGGERETGGRPTHELRGGPVLFPEHRLAPTVQTRLYISVFRSRLSHGARFEEQPSHVANQKRGDGNPSVVPQHH
jgi:hypothetical protein